MVGLKVYTVSKWVDGVWLSITCFRHLGYGFVFNYLLHHDELEWEKLCKENSNNREVFWTEQGKL